MPLILCIETATPVCSVALGQEGKTLSLRETGGKNSHSSLLSPFIDAVMAEAGLALGLLDAVAVSMGPGSYTGLRIGVSAAKGLCYALGIPLVAVSTLKAMAAGMIEKTTQSQGQLPPGLLYCPMIDARRMEVFTALFDGMNRQVGDTRALVVDRHSFDEQLSSHRVVFFGDGAAKCRQVIGRPGAVFDDEFMPSARHMIRLAEKKFADKDFADTAYFEPFYLKDFIAGVPRVKGLQ
jgi:tRNA threonylcarbamoyladenosine biosynthesis protein TsaB